MQGRMAATLAVAVVVSSAGCTIDDDQERAIGQDAAAQVEREVPLVTDEAINGYVTSLGMALATNSDDRNRPWQFRVVDAEQMLVRPQTSETPTFVFCAFSRRSAEWRRSTCAISWPMTPASSDADDACSISPRFT